MMVEGSALLTAEFQVVLNRALGLVGGKFHDLGSVAFGRSPGGEGRKISFVNEIKLLVGNEDRREKREKRPNELQRLTTSE